MAEYAAMDESDGKLIKGANALQPTSTATTLRLRDGRRMVTDGPFAETREHLGGYYLIEVANLDEALAFAIPYLDAVLADHRALLSRVREDWRCRRHHGTRARSCGCAWRGGRWRAREAVLVSAR